MLISLVGNHFFGAEGGKFWKGFEDMGVFEASILQYVDDNGLRCGIDGYKRGDG